MPRNGAGVFSLVNNTWFPPVNGVLATATDWTTFITDIQNALTQSVSSDGQTAMTGNLPLGNNKITGLANGTAATDAAAYGQVLHSGGQCRLTLSGANLLLSPFNGNQLVINGQFQVIPAAGVTLAPGAAVAATVYYIYAFMVGAVMTLEFSTTGHTPDLTTGVEIKVGDSTRTLVGLARPNTGPVWVDNSQQRFVISWFNRRPIALRNSLTAGTLISSTTFVELSASLRNEFLTWSDSSSAFHCTGAVANSVAASFTISNMAIDGALTDGSSNVQPTTAAFFNPVACSTTIFGVAEGYHNVSLFVRVTGGTGTWNGAATVGDRTTMTGTIFG